MKIGNLIAVAALIASASAAGAEAKDIARGEKVLWSSYMICFPVSRDFQGFKDRPLDRALAKGARLVDLRSAVQAGVDAFSVDLFLEDKYALGVFGQLVKLVSDNRLPLQLSPMFDGFQRPGLTAGDVVAKVQRWFEKFAHEPCVVRFEGRPEVAVYASQRGTRQFRQTWRLVAQSATVWVQQSTWDDFSENHHLMPSENYSTTFIELNRYLAAEWKGKPESLDAPRLYLSQQQEVLVGEEAEFELLTLLRPQDVPASVDLRISDAQGRCVKTFESVRLAVSGLQAAEFRVTVADLPSGRLLFPEGRLLVQAGKAALAVRGPYVSVADREPLARNKWQHVAATYDGKRLRLYRDGRLVGEKDAPGEGRCGQVGVGYHPVTRGACYRGELDELRLSARALTPAEFGPHNPLRRHVASQAEDRDHPVRPAAYDTCFSSLNHWRADGGPLD